MNSPRAGGVSGVNCGSSACDGVCLMGHWDEGGGLSHPAISAATRILPYSVLVLTCTMFY